MTAFLTKSNLWDDPVEFKESIAVLYKSICLFFNVEKLGLISSDSKKTEGDWRTLMILLIVHEIAMTLFPTDILLIIKFVTSTPFTEFVIAAQKST